jgi:hypothetical protein
VCKLGQLVTLQPIFVPPVVACQHLATDQSGNLMFILHNAQPNEKKTQVLGLSLFYNYPDLIMVFR